jgi:cytoskeletal protein CcmA (bactofilin family)
MAIFSSANSPPARKRPEMASLSIIAADLEVLGHLEARSVIKVEGRVQGNVSAGDQVFVAPGAVVEGNIVAREAVIGGVVEGAIEGGDRVELLETAIVKGNIVTSRLLIHEGGQLNGEIMMAPLEAEPTGEPSRRPAVAETTV